jgi:hypothetical protein
MTIPNIIHFVWAGKILPRPNIDIIKSWHESSPSSEIWLWTDFKGKTPEEVERIKKIYAEEFSDISTFKLKDIERPVEDNAKIQLRDEYIRYEVDRMRPNYGSFSDLWRYKALEYFGGGYFDSDVNPGILSFEELVASTKDSTEHLLYLDPYSQGSHQIGNDSIVATKGNLLMSRIYENAKKYYSYKNHQGESRATAIVGVYNRLPQRLYWYDDNSENGYIFQSTPVKTGSMCIQNVVDTIYKTSAEITATSAQIRTLQGYTTHCDNDKAWVNMPIEQMEENVALKKINDSIKFEAEKLGILRLDDHINNFVAATEEAKRTDCMSKVLEIAKKIDLNSIDGVQLTFENPKAVDFCNQHGILEKCFLFPLSDFCESASSDPKYFQKAIKLLFDIDLFKSIVPTLKSNPASVDTNIEAIVKRCVAIDLFSDFAMSYCSAFKRSKTKEVKRIIAEDYLMFILERTQDTLQELDKIHSTLNDVQAKQVIQSCQTLITKMVTKIDEFADKNDFKFGDRNNRCTIS